MIPSDLPQPAYNTSSDLHLLRMLALAIAVGILGAFAVLSFRWLLIFSETCIYGTRLGLVADAAMLPPLLRAVSPAIGGLLAGLILEYLAGQGKGKNGADYMEAIVAGRDLPARDSLLKSAASAASVVSGGSIGREGSMVQLAALTGSAISDWLHSAPSERHFLIACGAAAGVAGAYNTPIAGSLFVAEIVLGGITISRLGPLLLASTVSDLVVRHITHVGPIYAAAPGKLSTAPELMLVALLGIGAGVLGSVFVRLMDTTHNAFRHLTLPLWIKMATAGLAVGTLSTIRPEVWGNGYSVINSLL
ncbi:MAG: chloride channel protein, partial [Dissulfurimicrobium sp.]